jgi:phosphonate transport system permease protein
MIETINIASRVNAHRFRVRRFISGTSGCTRGLARWPRLIAVFVRRLMDGMRAIPEIVIALVSDAFILGGGPVPAMIAMAIHTARRAWENVLRGGAENTDHEADRRVVVASGASWIQKMYG